MQAINSVSSTTAFSQTMAVSGTSSTPDAGLTSAPQAEAAVTSSSTISSFSMVNEQVGAMLGAIDPSLAGQDMLRLLIALLILQVLMGKDQNDQLSGALMMAGLGGSSDPLVGLQSNLSMTQIEQSTTLACSQPSAAAGAYTDPTAGSNSAGSSLDVTG